MLTALAIVAKAESPHDLQNNVKLAETICTELKAGQFDLLESQYRDFTDRVHQIQPDGTPKNWIYFWSFELCAAKAKSLEAAQVFTQKIRDWLGDKPNSVPATLAVENAV